MKKNIIINKEIQGHRFIAFLDIMGFKDFVMRNSHKKVYNMLKEISDTMKSIERKNHNDKYYQEAKVYTVSFSDSIILYSNSGSKASFDLITYAIRHLFSDAIEKGIPLKGAFAYGNLSIDKENKIYFGQPLIDAYLLEEEVEYYGIICHHSIVNYLNINKSNLKTRYLFKECITPLKTGKIYHHNIDWFSAFFEGEQSNVLNKKEISQIINNFKTKMSGKPSKYIDNTLDILNNLYS